MPTVFHLLQMGCQSSDGWANTFVYECGNLPSKPPDKTSNAAASFSRKVIRIRTIWLVHSRWWRTIEFTVRPVIKLQFIYTVSRRVSLTGFVFLWVIHKECSTLSSKLSTAESWNESVVEREGRAENATQRLRGEKEKMQKYTLTITTFICPRQCFVAQMLVGPSI